MAADAVGVDGRRAAAAGAQRGVARVTRDRRRLETVIKGDI